MNRNSLRSRVITFYVGTLAIALIVFSAAVYFGVGLFFRDRWSRYQEKRISLRFRPGPATYVTGDSMRLRQIVVNLVDNAIKCTPDEGNVSVFVTAEEKRRS